MYPGTIVNFLDNFREYCRGGTFERLADPLFVLLTLGNRML